MTDILKFLAPSPILQLLDNNGSIVPGGKLFVYNAGTTTKATSYTDSTGATPNTNPIIADASGRLSCFLSPNTAYKLVYAPASDTDPPASPFWTIDGIMDQATTLSISGVTYLLYNLTWDGTNFRYLADGLASCLIMYSDGSLWYEVAASGTAGNVASLAVVMKMTKDGIMGLGSAPSSWISTIKVLELSLLSLSSSGNTSWVGYNTYQDAVGWKYKATGFAAVLAFTNDGSLTLYTAPSGTVGTAITWTSRFAIATDGTVTSGKSVPGSIPGAYERVTPNMCRSIVLTSTALGSTTNIPAPSGAKYVKYRIEIATISGGTTSLIGSYVNVTGHTGNRGFLSVKDQTAYGAGNGIGTVSVAELLCRVGEWSAGACSLDFTTVLTGCTATAREIEVYD